MPDSIVYTDSFANCDVIDVSTFHHRRIDHAKAFAKGKGNERHINGIENFWNQAKRHLRRQAAFRANTSTTSSGECEWRTGGGNHKELHRGLLGVTSQHVVHWNPSPCCLCKSGY